MSPSAAAEEGTLSDPELTEAEADEALPEELEVEEPPVVDEDEEAADDEARAGAAAAADKPGGGGGGGPVGAAFSA